MTSKIITDVKKYAMMLEKCLNLKTYVIAQQEASGPDSSAVLYYIVYDTQPSEHQMTMIWPFNAKVKCHEVNWKTIYDLLYMCFM